MYTITNVYAYLSLYICIYIYIYTYTHIESETRASKGGYSPSATAGSIRPTKILSKGNIIQRQHYPSTTYLNVFAAAHTYLSRSSR